MRRSDDPPERAMAALASRQHGVVAHRQLIAFGIGPRAIHRRVENGSLHPLHRGVYAVGHAAITLHGRWMAAVLACGPGAVLSHRDAAALHHLRPSSRPAIDVTAAPRHRAGSHGITTHRSRTLRAEDCTTVDGIPVTTVARTLLDLAEVVPLRHLVRAIEEAERRRIFDLKAVERLLERSHGRRGLRPMKRALAETREHIPDSRNDFERLLIDACRDARLPLPKMNVNVNGFEVDALWADQYVIAELDSRGFHDNRAAFESDRVKYAELQLAGYKVVPITYRRLTQAPGEAAHLLRRALS